MAVTTEKYGEGTPVRAFLHPHFPDRQFEHQVDPSDIAVIDFQNGQCFLVGMVTVPDPDLT